jgi:ABC-type sugar transport system ATPase subunit
MQQGRCAHGAKANSGQSEIGAPLQLPAFKRGNKLLMNLLGGNLVPDAGSMRFRGTPYAPASPREARDAGIGFVHQELNLFGNLSLAENLFLNGFPMKGPFIRNRELMKRAAGLLSRVGLDLPPSTEIGRAHV